MKKMFCLEEMQLAAVKQSYDLRNDVGLRVYFLPKKQIMTTLAYPQPLTT